MRRAQREHGQADAALESCVDEEAQDEEIGGKGESPGRHGLTYVHTTRHEAQQAPRERKAFSIV